MFCKALASIISMSNLHVVVEEQSLTEKMQTLIKLLSHYIQKFPTLNEGYVLNQNPIQVMPHRFHQSSAVTTRILTK
jgi:hypothetical protein